MKFGKYLHTPFTQTKAKQVSQSMSTHISLNTASLISNYWASATLGLLMIFSKFVT